MRGRYAGLPATVLEIKDVVPLDGAKGTELDKTVGQAPPYEDEPSSGHFEKPYLEAIWAGGRPSELADAGLDGPCPKRVSPGDRLLLKASGGPVCGLATVEAVEHYEDLTPERIAEILPPLRQPDRRRRHCLGKHDGLQIGLSGWPTCGRSSRSAFIRRMAGPGFCSKRAGTSGSWAGYEKTV